MRFCPAGGGEKTEKKQEKCALKAAEQANLGNKCKNSDCLRSFWVFFGTPIFEKGRSLALRRGAAKNFLNAADSRLNRPRPVKT